MLLRSVTACLKSISECAISGCSRYRHTECGNDQIILGLLPVCEHGCDSKHNVIMPLLIAVFSQTFAGNSSELEYDGSGLDVLEGTLLR
jgi:hypothetical protein